MGLERQRVVGASVALLGVLLAVPSVFAPTWHLTNSDRERGALLSELWGWSWGRSRLVAAGGVELEDLWNPLGLAVFVVLLLIALAGIVVWVRGPAWALLAGPVGVALLAGRLLTTTADRAGRDVREDVYSGSGLTILTDTPRAGVLETAAAVVLLVALAAMAYTLLRGDPIGGAPWDGALSWGRRHTTSEEGGVTDGPGSGDGSHVTVSLRPAGEHLTAKPVAFGDPGDEETRG
ncbi:hypothetical protein ACWEOW_04945 [Monashia sp. NPDC004114]